MGNWSEFEFNGPYIGKEINKINNIDLPRQYVEFMKEHNGGEGDIDETWFILYPIDKLQEMNDLYEISDVLPGHIIIGTNGGGEFYGIDSDGYYFNVSSMFDEEDIILFSNDIDELPDEINKFWKE